MVRACRKRRAWLRECIWENVEGNRGRWKSQRRWKNEIKDLLLGRRLSERKGMRLARDRYA